MNIELSLLLWLARHLPRVRGSGRLGHRLATFYRRKKRSTVVCDVLGFRMRLDPMEYVDGDILFVPQICERRERRLLERALKPGHTFIDVGCHSGFYSLFASRLVGSGGRVYAIDADEHSISRLKEHIALNSMINIVPIHSGVSTRQEVLPFGINLRGNRGASSFRRRGQETKLVPCYPLLHYIRQYDMGSVSGMKLDIEEMGYDVLNQFFAEADPILYPPVLIVEKEDGLRELLRSRGYKLVAESGLNWSFYLDPRG